jgi:HEAT repeat protein
MHQYCAACLVTLIVVSSAVAQSSEELIKRLKDPDARTRRLAAEALGSQKVEAAVSDLAALLKDRETSVRKAAADALVAIGPRGVPALADALSFPDEASRLEAVTALRRCGPAAKEAVPALATALKDRAVNVRIRAAMALGKIGADAKAALPALIEASRDLGHMGGVIYPDQPSGVAEAAIEAALAVDPKCREQLARAALPDLTAAVKSKDWVEVMTAASALAALGPDAKPAIPALREAQKTAKAFAVLGIERALKAAGDTNPGVDVIADPKAPVENRLAAFATLRFDAQPDDKTLAAFKEALTDPEPRIRAAAAEAVGALGPQAKGLLPGLLSLLGDEELEKAAAKDNPEGGNVVVLALARMGADAVPGLVEVFKDQAKKPTVRWEAVKALARLGRKARTGLPALEEGMKDKLLPLAVESACAYVRAGGDPDKAAPVLKEGLKHNSAFVAWNAAHAVERIGPKAKDAVPLLMPLLEHKDVEVRVRAAHALGAMGSAGKEGAAAIGKLVVSGDRRLRYQAFQALQRLGPDARGALPHLIESLASLEAVYPNPVLVVLGQIGPDARDAVPALVGLLKTSKDKLLPDDVVDTLGQIGPGAKAAVPRIVAILAAESEFSRARAARALGRMGPAAAEAVPALKKLLQDESKMVRVWAAFALARVTEDGKTYVPMLVEWWKKDGVEERLGVGSLRFDLAGAFELLGAEARPARDLLLEAALDAKVLPGTRTRVAHALGHLGDDAEIIVPKMVELLGRPLQGFDRAEMYVAALETLSLLGPKAKEAAPAVRRALDDDDNSIAEAAARALERIEGKP